MQQCMILSTRSILSAYTHIQYITKSAIRSLVLRQQYYGTVVQSYFPRYFYRTGIYCI